MEDLPENESTRNMLIRLAQIETHYFSQDVFLTPGELLANMARIQHIKAFIVHGAKDFLCPVANAFLLHQEWPKSELTIIENAGHLSSAPGMQEAMQAGVEYFLRTLPH